MLAEYVVGAQRLIRDRSAIMVPETEMVDYVNTARNDVCRITACLRRLIAGNTPFGGGSTTGLMVAGGMTLGAADTSFTTLQTLPGVERYAFSYFTPALRAQWAGIDRIVDMIEVAVSWGGAARPVMEWKTWEDLQALGRIYSVGVFTYPFCCACQGDGVDQILFLFPVPSQSLEMEVDASCLPLALRTNNDYEAIPRPFRDAVKFKAASYCYLSQQRFGSAELMEEQFVNHLGIDRVASERGRVPSYYDWT